MTRPRPEVALFLTILAGYLIAGALFAVYTPPWQAPDEPAHYNYVRQVAENSCCPRVEIGDWQSDYLQDLTSTRFAPEALERLYTIQYEDHHPPLYYLLASLVYKLGNGSLVALRLFSVLLGAITVGLTYAIGKRILPGQAQIALGAMALVAFLPQHVAMMSAVNNDALAEALVAFGLLWMIRYLKGNGVPIWQMGLIAGLVILCKITIYFLLLLFPLAIWLAWTKQEKPISILAGRIAAFVLVALVIGGGWWLRNISAYGFPDFLGLGAHDAVVADQPRTIDYVDKHGWINYARQLIAVSFKSFWGQFGWMALPLDSVLGGWIYRGFALLTLAGLSGSLLAARTSPASENSDMIARRHIRIIFTAAILIVLLAFFYYNLEFLQWQGRYLFPALIPIALSLVAGIDAWRARIFARWDSSRWLTSAALMCLFPLDIYLLFRVIAPGLSP
ncbi:MAG: DUF2142 domain-containing protein [Chloroflexi bacterium]|nr:DUF2142 domain-containing protein [Chloroflexota bacterium]